MKYNKKDEKLVKKLYETYPYPNRGISDPNKLKNYAKWILKIFDQNISFWEGKDILELGCGTGELANALGLCKAKVTAIDLSSSSIKKAQKLKLKLKNKNVEFKQANMLNLNLEKKFDIVIALGSMHHTIDARGAFNIGAEHTKENGIIIIGLYNKYSRFRHRLKRIILLFLAGKNIEKRIYWGKKLFKGNNAKSWLADKYGQVHESYHSINEILKWFKEENISFLASKPKFKTPIIDELKWLFKKQNAFFVMIGRKGKKK